nr:MAG TPA: hypothetical protein [Caudoviricetes sp.]
MIRRSQARGKEGPYLPLQTAEPYAQRRSYH